MPKRMMGEVFGGAYGTAVAACLLATTRRRFSPSEVREACVSVAADVLQGFSKRSTNRSGVGIQLFFPLDELGVAEDSEEGLEEDGSTEAERCDPGEG